MTAFCFLHNLLFLDIEKAFDTLWQPGLLYKLSTIYIYIYIYIYNDLRLSRMGICGRYISNETSAPSKQGPPHHWQISKEHHDSWYAYIPSNSILYDYITKLCRQQAQVIQHHENIHVRNIGQGEARYRKYKTFKLGDGQAYDRSND
jgi:hypothetical protein